MEDFHDLGDHNVPNVGFHRPTPACQLDGECALCRRLQESDQVILQAKTLLHRALEHRNRLKMENNHVNDPFSQRLPVEIACRIFTFCLPALPAATNFAEIDCHIHPKPFQLILGSVCQSWRGIVWSNPRFWNYVNLALTRGTHPSFAGFVNNWIGRSGRLPLVIIVHLRQETGESQDMEEISAPFVDPLVQVLKSYAERWSLFAAFIPKWFWRKLQHNSAQAILEGLVLRTNDQTSTGHGGERIFNLGVAPSPKVLSLQNYRPRDIHLEFHNLTHFKGTSLLIADCLEVLRRSPQLFHCHFGNTSNPVAWQDMHDTAVHYSLKSLELTDFPRALANAITLPCVERIDFTMCHEPFASLLPFIRRCGYTIKSAAFSDADPNDEGLMEVLEYTPSLEYLSLVEVKIGDNFFRRLRETSCFPEGQTSGFLPSLKSLTFWTCQPFEWSHLHKIIMTRPLPPLMQRRPLSSITVDVFGDPGESGCESETDSDLELIGKEDLEKILDLIEFGVDIRVRDETLQDIIAASQEYYNTEQLSDEDIY